MTPRVSHVEWRVADLDRSVAFLEELFGWRFEVYSTHYRLYQPEQGVAVGLLETAERRPGLSPMVHIQVEAIDPLLDRARALGALVVVGRTAVPGHGWYAQFEDSDGNLIGVFEASAD
ncbi:MAG: VOC family protein [Candidatus Competibacterales bacterium]|nr:VOC family protein [Candidatus Competibacterales bacterium]